MNDNLSAIPIANIAYRLKRLQRFIDHEQFKENPVIVPSLLEQAAKEVCVGFIPIVRKLQGQAVGQLRQKILKRHQKQSQYLHLKSLKI